MSLARLPGSCSTLDWPRAGPRCLAGAARPALPSRGPPGPARPLPAARHSDLGLRRRRQVVAASGGSGGGGSGDGLPAAAKGVAAARLKMQLELLATLLVRYPALVGSIAVASGFLLKVDPLGNLHWNGHDALLGLQCALPIMLLDSLLMVPDYSPGTTTKVIKLKAPRAVAEKLKQQEAERAAREKDGRQDEGNGSSGLAAAAAAAAAGAAAALLPKRGEEEAEADAAAEQRRTQWQQKEEGAARGESESEDEVGTAVIPPLLDAVVVVDKSGGPLSISIEEQPGANRDAADAAAGAAAGAGAGAAAAAEKDDLVEIERTITVRGDQHPVLAALYRVQLDKASSNVARMLPYPLEIVLVLAWHLAEEMLWRAIVLTCAVGWTIDRLYEAGADETVNLLGMQLATPQAGALFAAVGCTTLSLVVLVQRSLFPVRLLAKAEQELEASEAQEAEREAQREAQRAKVAGLVGGGLPPQPGKKAANKQRDRQKLKRVLDKVKTGLVRQRKWSTAIEGSRDVLEWAAYSTSFLLTGNLLAPYVTAVASDLLFSGFQRYKNQQVGAANEQSMKTIKELHETAMALRDARKSSLQPRAAKEEEGKKPDGPASGSNGSAAKLDAAEGAEPEPAAKEEEKDPAGVGSGSGSSKSGRREE